MKRGALAGLALAILAGLVTAAADGPTATIELRVWQSTDDLGRVYVSARPDGERWQPTTRVRFDAENAGGTYRYGDHTIDVMLPETGALVTPTDETPPDSFVVVLRENDRGLLDASAHVPIVVRSPGSLYVIVQLEDGSSHNCWETHTMLPEDGLQNLGCSYVYAGPEDVRLMWANLFLGPPGLAHQYRCELTEHPLLPPDHWTCRLLRFE